MITSLLIVSMLPAIILLFYVNSKDHVEKEPPALLIKLFFFGMLSALIAMLPEMLLEPLFSALPTSSTLFSSFLSYLLGVAAVEEGSKFLLLSSVRHDPNFNYTFDGIVYGVCVGLGFAALENLLYVIGFGDYGLGIVRDFTAIPLHCVCGVYMGYYYGLAHLSKARGQLAGYSGHLWQAFLVPTFIHGFYDFGVSSGNGLIAFGMFLFVIIVFTLAIARVKKSSAEDTPID